MRYVRASIIGISLAAASAACLSIGSAWADTAPATPAAPGTAAAAAAPATAAKPALPAISDLLDAAGISATGYVSGTFNYQTFSESGGGAPGNYDTFTLQQAAFTLAKQPSSGFGALVNVVAGQNIYQPNYAPFTYGPQSSGASAVTSTQLQLAQGYAQYATGPITIIGGKFATLAGVESFASVNNTNITRSILYAYEPVTHTGARLTWAANGQLSLIIGVNNGWFYSDESAAGSDKTLEAGVAWTPSKVFSWALQGYTGRDTTKLGTQATQSLIDTVATWNATSALTLIGSFDWAQVDNPYGAGTSSASWWGVAGYINYALSSSWRVSLRGEYYDDTDGYLTLYQSDYTLHYPGGRAPVGQNMAEGTVDFGFDPTKNLELRLEARYDDYQGNSAVGANALKVTQGWLEALYKF
jgi:hypothetical protein